MDADDKIYVFAVFEPSACRRAAVGLPLNGVPDARLPLYMLCLPCALAVVGRGLFALVACVV